MSAYTGTVGSAAAFREGMVGVWLLGPVLGTKLVADVVFVIGSTGMTVGGLSAFVLDNTIAGSRAERGLEESEASPEADGEFDSAYDRFVRGADGSTGSEESRAD